MLKAEGGGVCFEGSKVNIDGESSLHSSWTSLGDFYNNKKKLIIDEIPTDNKMLFKMIIHQHWLTYFLILRKHYVAIPSKYFKKK